MSLATPRRRFAAAIFDMDGLLLDSERVLLQLWTEATRRRGIDFGEHQFLRMVGLNEAESRPIMLECLGHQDTIDDVSREVGAQLRARMPCYALKPGVHAALDYLRARDVPRAVASSSRAATIQRHLGAHDVLGHFHAFAGGDEVPRGKPDPAVYRLAAERIAVDPAHCLAFEDSEPGATAALAAGMQVVMIPDLKSPGDALRARALHVLPSLDAALAHFPEWFGH
jgi:HAD superfamily hydrolase (TIGR01509 family)